ncbi:MAG: hypothetical protein WAT78_16250 [Rhizobiaceae bacterium]
MNTRTLLAAGYAATLCALALMVIAVITAMSSNPHAGQEQFETIRAASLYSAELAAAGPGLRRILFIDGLFMLAYTVAIGFTVMAFADRNRPAAWFAGIGIVAVLLLDALENATMAQSVDLLDAGGALTLDRIAWQASVSGMKWQSAAAALLAVSFVLPTDSILERILVWGVRLGLPVAVPLFIMGAFGLREIGGQLLLLSMSGGFILLALVLRGRMRSS